MRVYQVGEFTLNHIDYYLVMFGRQINLFGTFKKGWSCWLSNSIWNKPITHSSLICDSILEHHNSENKRRRGIHFPSLCLEIWKMLIWCQARYSMVRLRHILSNIYILGGWISCLGKLFIQNGCWTHRWLNTFLGQSMRFSQSLTSSICTVFHFWTLRHLQ